MVKIPTKPRKSKIATPPKTVSTYKAAKKSEKPKTKGVSKPKVTLSANKRYDLELPCSSKQAAGFGIGIGIAYGITSSSGGGGSSVVNNNSNNNCKTDIKVSWATSCSPLSEAFNKEQQQQQLQLQLHQQQQQQEQTTATSVVPNQQTTAAITTATTTTTTATTITPPQLTATVANSLNAVERYTAVDTDAEMQSKFRSGVRYSDVLRSKNVASNGSVKPTTLVSVLPAMPTQLMLSSNPSPSSNDVKDIDLTLFPELGQHRNCPSSNNGSTSVRLLQRTQTTPDEDSPQATLERLQPVFHGNECSSSNSNNHSSCSNNNINNSNSTSNNNNADPANANNNNDNPDESNDSTTPNSCPQCALNSLWVQHALFNSAQPYHMEIPEFNFLRADQNYPRFLGQFEDENYLKTENLALLGLKLALGGNFHSMHSNNGR